MNTLNGTLKTSNKAYWNNTTDITDKAVINSAMITAFFMNIFWMDKYYVK